MSLAQLGKLPDAHGANEAPSGLPAPTRHKKKKKSWGGSSTGSKATASALSEMGSQYGGKAGRRSTAGGGAKKVLAPTLTFQARRTPGKMRLRELDPRRIVFQESSSTRVVLDWRKNRWEGTYRLIDRLLPTSRKVQYTMKLTGVARTSIVPEAEGEPSSDDDNDSEESEEDDDAIVNSDDDAGSSTNRSSTLNSTATGSHLGTSNIGGDSTSGVTREMARASRRREKAKQKMTGWLSQYSGCTKGHGERLMRKIYKPKCEDMDVKMNSGVKQQLLISLQGAPCFCSLQAVNFRNYLIGNRGAQALWPLLRYARGVKSLNLAGNDIHDEGARFLVSALEADALNLGKDDVGQLLLVDFSKNPITGALADDLMKFNDKRKDVLMLGLADTMMPMLKRQKILRQCLKKFAGVEPHVMLEAWRLAADPRDFVDRELFIQCERIVEGIHGAAVHDMAEVGFDNNRRGGQLGSLSDDDDDWDNRELGEGIGRDSRLSSHLIGQDGFGGLDEDGEEGLSTLAQAPSDGRDTRLSFAPTPPPPRPPSSASSACGCTDGKPAGRRSWAARRRHHVPTAIARSHVGP